MKIRKIEAAYKSFQSHDTLFAGLKSWQVEVVHNTAMVTNYLGMEPEEAYTEAREQLVQAAFGQMLVNEDQMDLDVKETVAETEDLKPGGMNMDNDGAE
jgi:hypothetical protein